MINSGFKPWVYWYSSPGIKSGTIGIKGGLLRFLSNDQIKEIDHAAKEILSRTGVKIPNKECLHILEKAGAVVEHEKERAWVPPDLVDEAIKKTPKSFKFAGRDPKRAITLDTERVYFVRGIGPYMVTPDGSMSEPTLRDMQDCYRVLDACENVDVQALASTGHARPQKRIWLYPSR